MVSIGTPSEDSIGRSVGAIFSRACSAAARSVPVLSCSARVLSHRVESSVGRCLTSIPSSAPANRGRRPLHHRTIRLLLRDHGITCLSRQLRIFGRSRLRHGPLTLLLVVRAQSVGRALVVMGVRVTLRALPRLESQSPASSCCVTGRHTASSNASSFPERAAAAVLEL